MQRVVILLFAAMSMVSAFQVSPAVARLHNVAQIPLSVMYAEEEDEPTPRKKKKGRGVGSSGYKQERMNKLADLESERVETDKGFVLKAAGGFVGFILIVLVAAFASGVLDQV